MKANYTDYVKEFGQLSTSLSKIPVIDQCDHLSDKKADQEQANSLSSASISGLHAVEGSWRGTSRGHPGKGDREMIKDEDLHSSIDYSGGQREAAHRILVELCSLFVQYQNDIRDEPHSIFMFNEPLDKYRYAEAKEHRTIADWAYQCENTTDSYRRP